MKTILAFAVVTALAMPVLANAATGASVTLDPPTATLSTTATINASFASDLVESALVVITFPDLMRVPDKIADGLVLVNTLPATGIEIDGQAISIAVPEPQEQRREFAFHFPITAGLKNPFKAGTYQISVESGLEKATGTFVVEKILQDAPKVSVKPDKVGKTIGITVQIPHPEGLVVQKDDMLDIIFPQEFIFPETLDLESVFACGSKPSTIITDSNSIKLTFSRDVPHNEPLTIVIEPSFGIRSPLWPGNFYLIVGIPGKMEDTASEMFQIFPLLPTLSLIIDPPMPETGWFSSLPRIQIVSTAKRQIHYSWDSSPRILYGEPLEAEPGIHVLSYVGRVEDGGWEAELSETFRIDVDEPVINQLANSANTESFKLAYSVTDTSQCLSGVGGREAENVGFNRFEIDLELDAGANKFVLWAEDAVGRRIEMPHSIVLDKTPPALTVAGPLQASVVCGREVTVTGKTEPGAKVRINGNEVIPNSKGDFIGVIKPVDEGPTDILVEAVDPAGNINSVKVPILYIRSTRIVLKIGSSQAVIAGKTKEIEAHPYEKFGTMYIPIATISGWLGYRISTKDKKTYTLEDKQKNRVTFTLESNVITIEGKQGTYTRNMDGSPEASDGSVFVPVEFIDKGLGLEIQLDSNTITILFCPKG